MVFADLKQLEQQNVFPFCVLVTLDNPQQFSLEQFFPEEMVPDCFTGFRQLTLT